jgi:hypothetical protein
MWGEAEQRKFGSALFRKVKLKLSSTRKGQQQVG